MTLFKMWQKQMRQKAKNGRKKLENADFHNATNANKKGSKKEKKKNSFLKIKKSGNEVAGFQNATNICGRSYCCTL